MYNHIDRVINFALQYSTYPPAYPIEIGKIILQIYPEQNLLTSAILYSTIDHSSHKNISKGLKQIKDYFGPHTAHKISNITKFSNYEHIAYDLTQIRKFTGALNLVDKTTNSSILLIKLARLLHSLSVFNNYYSLSYEQIKLISLDILEVYLPLISGVDIEDVKTELQEFCTKILYPDINKDIKKHLGVIDSSEEFLNDVVEDLNKELSNSQIKATVSGRIKSYYSIWRKLHYKNTTIEQLNDIIGLRIVVDNTDDCYSALKVIHQRYQSLPKKFHDFINIPKGNGYQSLHTVIVGPKSQKLEVQIRTTEMHQVAQFGSAAHWQYKHDFTKILSVFIAAQKLYTKPTVNLATPNSVTQHNNSNVNTTITVANVQLNTLAIHMISIGLLAVDNNEQSVDDKVATDEDQYITSQQTEYADSCIAVQPLVCGVMNLLFKFMQDSVYDQIMIFIVGSDIANVVNVSVDAKERKVQEFWDDISYISNSYNVNGNKQNKNSKNVSSNSKKEVVVVSCKSDMRGNCDQMLVNINSSVTENTDIAKTNTLTKTESNYNKLNSEQTTREEKQEINSTQDIFSTKLPVSNISYNTTNITNLYEPELQNEGVKFTDDGVQCFQSTLNTTTASETKEDNTYLGCSSRDEGDNESKVIPDPENSTTNFENKGINSTNIIEEHTIKLHRYAAKILCAIMKTKEFRKQLQLVIEYDLISYHPNRILKLTEHFSNRTESINIQQLYNIFNSYESICQGNINAIFNSAYVDRFKLVEQNISIVNSYINDTLCQGPQAYTFIAIIAYLNDTLRYNCMSDIETLRRMELFITLCKLYYLRYDTNNQSVRCSSDTLEIATLSNVTSNDIAINDWDVISKIITSTNKYVILKVANLQKNWRSKADIESNKGNKESNKQSGNEGNIDQDTQMIKFIKSGDLLGVYNILCDASISTSRSMEKQHAKSKLENILDIKDEEGNTPILLAIRAGNFPITMLLLLDLVDSNLNVENEIHETPLSLAFTSLTINKYIINLLMQKIIIKYEKQLAIIDENFREFIASNNEFRQFYNACRSYVEKFSSIMIIDLLVEMSIVSPELMQNIVVGLYYKSYIDKDEEFRKYLKCIGSINTDTAEKDCDTMMSNDDNQASESMCTANSIVPEHLSTEDIEKLLKYSDQLQRLLNLKIEDKKVIEEMLKQWKCQSDVDCDAAPTTFYTICGYVLRTLITAILEYNYINSNFDEKQRSHSNQGLMERYKHIEEYCLAYLAKVVQVMPSPIQPYEYNGDDDKESITKDASALQKLCRAVSKVHSLAKDLKEELVSNRNKISIEYLTKQCEQILESIVRAKELCDSICDDETLYQKDSRKALPAPSDTKILPKCSITEFLCKINAEGQKSIMKEVREAIAKDIDNSQQMDDMDCILSHVESEIGLKNADSILVGEQHDSYNDHDSI